MGAGRDIGRAGREDRFVADALTATVERFNGFAANGVDDDFHRGEDPYDRYFSGGKPCVVAVDEPRTTRRRSCSATSARRAVCAPTPDARVLDASDRPIPGLYAAGNTSASFTGPVYPGPGVPIGSAMAFAYRAVQHIRRSST